MLPEQLKKVLTLVKRTGDRVIIFDANTPDDSFVVMGLDQYVGMTDKGESVKTIPAMPQEETLETVQENKEETVPSADLTEEDLTDKINREISMWKDGKSDQQLEENGAPKKAWNIPPRIRDNAQNVE